MSLINDALKKTQRQRGDHGSHSGAPPSGGAPVSLRPAAPAAGSQLWLLGAGALLGLGITLGAVFLLRDEPTAPNPAEPSLAAPPSAHAAAPATTPQLQPTTHAATPAPITATVQQPRESTGDSPLQPPANPPAATPVPDVTPAGLSTPPRPSLRMINTVEAFRIAGVRASGSDSKVLMNDRVYRIGDTVEHELRIKIASVTANSVTFSDESGATCTRNF